jgi:hypothetical protein
MPRYRVTLRYSAVEVVEAANPYMAALAVHDLHGDGVEVADVRPAVGRTAAATTVRKATNTAKATKKVAKKRKPMSAATRAKLAQNLVKARAARAAKARGAKKTARKRATAASR